MGLITPQAARSLERFGPEGITAGEAVAGGAPRVAPGAGLAAMWRAARGVAPGLLVTGDRGVLRGVITRGSLSRHVTRARRRGAPAALHEPDVSALLQTLDSDHRRLLETAAAVARSRGIALYLVGGIVRDLLLGRPGRDLDLVVEGEGIPFAHELAGRVGARVVAHAPFLTADLLMPGGWHVDVITARHERYDPPGSLPVVERGSLEDDLARRDVTINAMAIRLDGRDRGRLRDDMGGLADLKQRLLRVHHAMSLIDDPTRALRIARLAARLDFGLADETAANLDLARRARAMDRVSGSRLRRELELVLREPDPVAALDAMARLELLDPIARGFVWNALTRRQLARHVSGGPLSQADPFLVMLMILADGHTGAASRSLRAAIARRLALAGPAAGRLAEAPSRRKALVSSVKAARTPGAVARVCERHDPETLAFTWATSNDRVRRALETWARRSAQPVPGVTGHTLRTLGLPPGPAYARILGRIREAWLDRRIVDAASARAMARRLVRRAALTRTPGR